MVNNNPNQNNGDDNSVPNFEDLVREEPEREVDLSNFTANVKTVSEEEESSISLTDIQAILKSLSPKFKNQRLNELLQPAMVSRIHPDVLMDKHFLLASSTIEAQCYDPDFDPVAVISQTQDGLMIGFEGRGIADKLELAGVAHDAELEKLSKELGM